MAYIISVNSNILSQSGGTCVCDYANSADGVCDTDPAYMLCVQEINRDLVTATAAISALTSFCMGLFANMPIALVSFPLPRPSIYPPLRLMRVHLSNPVVRMIIRLREWD